MIFRILTVFFPQASAGAIEAEERGHLPCYRNSHLPHYTTFREQSGRWHWAIRYGRKPFFTRG